MKITKIHVWKTNESILIPFSWVIDIYIDGQKSESIKLLSEVEPYIQKFDLS